MTVIALRQVAVRYGGLVILQGVSAEAPAGAFIGLCGANGTGKTTLMRLILGLEPPWSGQVTVFGGDPWRQPAVRRQIGYLPQTSRLNPHFPLCVRDLVGLGLLRTSGLRGGWRCAPRKVVDEALNVVGLRDLADKPLRELSGGQMQLALLARAFAGRPRLLLLDEPLTGLDQARQSTFYQRVADWQAEVGATVIAVCHESHSLHQQATMLWRLDAAGLRVEEACA